MAKMTNLLFKEPLAPLTYLAVTIGVSLVAPLVILGATIGLSLIIPNLVLDTTFLTIYFIITCTLYNSFLMLVLGLGRVEEEEDVAHYFSILIPAHNEEDVIGETLEHVLNLDYPSELFEVIVVNDGSTDNTEQVVRDSQKKHPNLKLINMPLEDGGKGKGSVLNNGFANFLLTWRGLEIRPRHRWIIGVFDADATPEVNMLKKVSFQFNELRVGGVQTLVRIKNREKSLLARMQDVEFIAFAKIVQFARTIFRGSVALGGNGQFVRATALDTVVIRHLEEYWRKDSLTEDLDIGVRLIIKKWENRYVNSTAVHQEGPETWSTLLRQRTRWAWGTLQTLAHYVLNLRLWKGNVSLKKKVDVSIYLVHIMLPFLVLLCLIWSGLGLLGVIKIHNVFPFAFCVANGFSFLPFYGYGLWKERKECPLWQIIPLALMATIFTYHWIPCVTSAIIKMITNKPIWSKTPRFKNNHTPKTLYHQRTAIVEAT